MHAAWAGGRSGHLGRARPWARSLGSTARRQRRERARVTSRTRPALLRVRLSFLRPCCDQLSISSESSRWHATSPPPPSLQSLKPPFTFWTPSLKAPTHCISAPKVTRRSCPRRAAFQARLARSFVARSACHCILRTRKYPSFLELASMASSRVPPSSLRFRFWFIFSATAYNKTAR